MKHYPFLILSAVYYHALLLKYCSNTKIETQKYVKFINVAIKTFGKTS